MTLKLRLSEIPLFQFLTLEQADLISQRAKVITKHRGDSLLIFNEPVPGIFIVASGKVGVYAQNSHSIMAEIGEGGSFGEMSFVDEAKASATIRCETDEAQVVFFNRRDFDSILKNNPGVAAAIFNGVALTLSKRLRENNSRVASELDRGLAILARIEGRDTQEKASALCKAMQTLIDGYSKRLDSIYSDLSLLQEKTPSAELISAQEKIRMLRKNLSSEMEDMSAKVKEVVDFIAQAKKNFHPLDYR